MLYKDVSRRLAEQIDTVVRRLYPSVKLCNGDYVLGNIHGEPGQSLRITGKGEHVGKWTDFATGQKGDLIDLWALRSSITPAEAFREVKYYLGIGDDLIVSPRPKSFVKSGIDGVVVPNFVCDGQVYRYLTAERRLTPDTLKAFGLILDEKAKEIGFPSYQDNKLELLKTLKLERPGGKKAIFVKPRDAKKILFGWQAFDFACTALILTEGELDAMSLYQYELGHGVLSVPFGGGQGDKQNAWIDNEFDRLQTFKEIYLCLDNDKVGEEAALAIAQRLGQERCFRVKLPFKDANECLVKGVSKEEILACLEASKKEFHPDIVTPIQYRDSLIKFMRQGVDNQSAFFLPFESTRHKIAFRPQELTVWSGINGHGKSQFLSYLVSSQINHPGFAAKVFVASLELTVEQYLRRAVKQVTAKECPSESQIEDGLMYLEGNLWLYKHQGGTNRQKLLEIMHYVRKRYDVRVFVIDSLMKCGIGEEDYNTQKLFVEALCDFKNDHDCHIHLVVHPKKQQDEDMAPGKLSIKGSGGVGDLADNIMTVFRNKKKEKLIRGDYHPKCEEERQALHRAGDVYLYCDKQRHGDWEGLIELWYNIKTYCYSDHDTTRAYPMIEM